MTRRFKLTLTLLVVSLLCLSRTTSMLAQTDAPPTSAPTAEAAQGGDSAGTTATPSPDEVVAAAGQALRRSDDLIDNVGLVLNFFEVLAGVATLILAAGAIFGFTSIRELRRDVEGERTRIEESRKDMETTMLATRDELQRLERDFEIRLRTGLDAFDRQRESAEAMQAKIEGEILAVRNRGDRAIRALTLVQLGEQQMEESNWQAAKRTFEEACKLDSDNRAVNYYLGELFIMQRDLTKAEFHLRKTEDEDEKGNIYPPAEAALAYVLRLQGDNEAQINSRNEYYSAAERRFLKALRVDDFVRDINGESVYGMLGALYRQSGRIDDAIRCYEKAAAITPDRSYPLNNLAMLYFRRGDVEKAVPYFDKTVVLAEKRIDNHPTDYWAYFDLINGLLACARSGQALNTFDEVLPRIGVRGPLESFLNGLTVLSTAPRPPQPLTITQLMIERVEHELQRLESKKETDADTLDFNDD